jgi:PAS domain S-box-containing protein
MLTLVFFMVNLVAAGVAGIIWWQYRGRFQGLGYWLADALLLATAILLIFARGTVPEGLSILASNACTITGIVLFCDGARRYFRLPGLHRAWYAIPVVTVGLDIPFTFINDDVNWRNVILSLAMAIVLITFTVRMVREVPADLKRFSRYFNWLALSYAILCFLRIAVNLLYPHQPDFFNGPLLDLAVLAGMEILIIALAFIQLGVTTYRLSLELAEGETRYRDLFSANRDGVLVVETDGRLMDANQAFCDMLGYSINELKSLPNFTVLTPERWQAWEQGEIRERRLHKQGFTGLYQKEYIRKDGSIIPVEIQSFAATGKSGQANYYWGIVRNIAGRLQSERRLKESEQKFSLAFQSSPYGIIITRSDNGLILDANDRFETFSGFSRADSIGKTTLDLGFWVREEDRNAILRDLSQGIASSDRELSFRKKGGSIIKTLFYAESLVVNNESLILSSFVDITDRKNMEDSLRASENRYRSLYASMNEGASLHRLDYDASGKAVDYTILDANPAYERLTGLNREKVVGQTGSALFGKNRPRFLEILNLCAQVVATGQPAGYDLHNYFLNKDFQISVSSPGPGLFTTIFSDVTARRRAEAALKESEERFRSLYTSMGEGVCLHRLEYDASGQAVDYTILDVNPSYESILGIPREKVIGKPGSAVYDSNPPPFLETYARVAATRVSEEFETGYTPMGKSFHISVSSPAPGQFATVFSDITWRIKADAALKESETRFRAITEMTSDGILLYDLSGSILTANQAAERMYGFTQGELVGSNFELLVAPSLREDLRNALQRTARGSAPRFKGLPFETLHIRRDGTEFPVEISTNTRLTGDKILITAIVRDITGRKLLEEERQRTARLESLGTLAGGIAHDFNNLLTAILGNVSLARIAPDQMERDGTLREAEKACERAAALARQLLTFAKGGAPLKETLDLATLLRETASFALRSSGSQPVYEIAPDLWSVNADRGQISQVIHNLVINAAESMSNSGGVIIRGLNIHLPAGNPGAMTPGQYVRVEVEDSGSGIPADNAIHIFDPYFSTRSTGRGLGLATARSIILRHNGFIDFRPAPKRGTVFSFLLPALPTTTTVKPGTEDRSVRSVISPGREERILVMDDEPQVREVAGGIIKVLGFKVATATRGEQTLEMYRQAIALGKPFNAVILDLTIRDGMGGLETLRKLKEIDPMVKAIVSSGYPDDPAVSSYQETGFSAVVAKPYRADEMAAALQQALGPG